MVIRPSTVIRLCHSAPRYGVELPRCFLFWQLEADDLIALHFICSIVLASFIRLTRVLLTIIHSKAVDQCELGVLVRGGSSEWALTDVFACLQTTLPCFTKPEFSVVRLHEEFIWLHHSLQENERYSGFIVSGTDPG